MQDKAAQNEQNLHFTQKTGAVILDPVPCLSQVS